MSGAPAPASPLPRSSTLRGLVGSSAIFALGNGLSRAVSYVMPPVLTAWIAPAEMGTVALLSVAVLVLRTVLGLGITTSAGAVWFDRPEQERPAVIATATLVLAGGGGLGLLLCAAAARPLASLVLGNPEASALLVLAFAGAALQLIAQPATMALQFQGRPLAHLAVTALGAAVGVVLTLALVAGLGRGVRGWLEAGVLAAALSWLAAALTARMPLRGWQGTLARDLVRVGWPFVPGAAFMAVVQGAGAFVLARTAGIASAGVYNAGFNLGMIMAIATTGFGAAWFPYFQAFAGREGESGKPFARVLLLCIAGFGAATVLFYAAAPLAIAFIPDDRYHGAAPVVGDVALLQALIGTWGVLVPVLYFRRKIWLASAVQGLAAAVTVPATIGCIALAGPAAAAWGAVAGVAVMIAAQLGVNRWLGGAAALFPSRVHAGAALVALVGIVGARWIAATLAPVQTLSACIVLVILMLAGLALVVRRGGSW